MKHKNLTPSDGELFGKWNERLRDYIYSGVSDDKYDFQNTRTLMLNVLCLISLAFLISSYLFLSLKDGFFKHSWLLLFTFHLFYVLYLNRKKKFRIAKVLFLSLSILSIGFISLVIRGAGLEFNLLIPICLAPLLFGKMRSVLAYVAACCIIFFGVRYLSTVFDVDPLYFSNQTLTSSLSLGFAAMSSLLLLTAFQRLSVRFSDSLILNNKYANEKLSESKQVYLSLYDNMIEGFAYCKMIFENNKPFDFIYIDVNDMFEKQTGLLDVVGKKISEVIPGIRESNPELFEILGRVVLSENPERFEIYMPGINKWFDISSYSPLPGYFIAVFDLISERKVAEEQQKLFTSIINSSEDAIISQLVDGTITSWNPGAEKLFYYTAEEIIGKNISVIIPPQLHSEEIEILTNWEGIERHETQRIRKDGSIIFVSRTMSPILDSKGKLVGFSKISRDISQRLIAEADLKEKSSFNEGILASLSTQIAVIKKDGSIIEVNKAWNDFALENGENRLERVFTGSNYLDVCKRSSLSGDSIAKEVLEGLLAVINNEQPFFDLEYPCFGPGEQRWFSMRVTTFQSDEQKIVVTHEDITKRKQAENALVELNEQLELKIERRTKLLTTSKNELEKKNQNITDSITYALRLQTAMLPDSKVLYTHFSDSFIINLPQNIVSGDFYWFHKSVNCFMIACADSTGHGVPGAFMSIVGAQLLNRAIEQEWSTPSDIIKLIDEGLNKTLGANHDENMADGMDMAFCIIEPSKNIMEFAGAMSSIILDGSGKSRVYRGSRFALGDYMKMKDKHFETQSIKYNSGDMLYLYSDGLKDQFGGDDDKKFLFDRQVQLFEKIHHLPAPKQKKIIIDTFEAWKGELDQVDDVMVIGVRM